ncbi:PSD1 and planctomycete cytochrome C domain-containing protein [Pedosphaera parvula]|nr:PSD1 and planctomycete cytochrome C domain-containing protein [Pedosphaera parvula]
MLASLSSPAGAASNKQAKLEFNRDIRPILSENCYQCHGPDKGNRKAKLRLDVRDVALEKEAFKPGKPDESELVRRIYTTNEDDHMPPADSHKHLADAQKEKLKQWIAEGAKYQAHWAYIKPERPAEPKTKSAKWISNPIDSFVLHELEAKKLSPAAAADKRTLLRRLSLDLTGLPPTVAELDAFMKDSSSKAYEHQVDRLLASPHYGERMAVPWLDVARFADTVGYHGDQNVNVFPYRDYVINAFNQNKRYDQFTIEQLAGDLLPNPTTEQLIASGFNRLNMVTREGGAQPGEYLAKYGADRVRTVSTTFLGSTMGCCECHDHKFDPFATKDFYSMKAFFADIKQWGVYMDYSYTPNPDLKGFSNDHPFPPEITVDSPYLHRRLDGIEQRITGLEKSSMEKLDKDAQQKQGLQNWCDWSTEFLKQNPSGWITPVPQVTSEKKSEQSKGAVVVTDDKSILFSSKAGEGSDLKLPLSAGWVAALKLELLPRPEHDGSILMGKVKNDSTMVKLSAALKAHGSGKETPISFYHAEADRKEERYANGAAIIGVQDGWKTSMEHEKSPQTAVYLLDKPIQAKEGDELVIRLGKGSVGCVRISVSPFAAKNPLNSGASPALANALSKGAASLDELGNIYLISTVPEAFPFAQYKQLYSQALECREGKSPTLVTVSAPPMETRVLPRGNWQATDGEVVQPAVPHFLPQPPNPDGHRLTRLDLAKWLVSRDNPLTARTFVNRTWKQFFGTGISAVVDDLGAQGEWPMHPELLDWLAVEFMDSGWDMKHLVKLIVMSSTYRQSSNPRPEIHEMDPANRLLASQSPRRLEAEFIRDNALFISGLLNEDIGGPSSFPYQPAGYYANIQFPNRDYYPDQDERQYRRGLYAHWQRTFLQPMLANFDAPSREECTAIRNVSNSPQQALTLLNDPTFVEAARMLAGTVLAKAPANDEKRFEMIYQKALTRSMRPKERTSLQAFLKEQRNYYGAHVEDAKKLMHVGLAAEPKSGEEPELAAWTQVCRVVLGLHETITRY